MRGKKSGADKIAADRSGQNQRKEKRLHGQGYGKHQGTVDLLRPQQNPPAPCVRKDMKRIKKKRKTNPCRIHFLQGFKKPVRRFMDQENDDCSGKRRFQQSLHQRRKKDVPDSAGLSPLVAGTALIFHHLMFFPLFFIINYTICVCRDVFSYYIS